MEMLPCKIYVSGFEESRIIDIRIGQTIDLDYRTLRKSKYKILVKDNPKRDRNKSKSFPEGFRFHEHVISLSIPDDEGLPAAIALVNKILIALWLDGKHAIATCAFQDKLALGGGKGSINIPFKSTPQTGHYYFQRSIAWWESYRWLYNLTMLAAIIMATITSEWLPETPITDVILYSITWLFSANIFYCIGAGIEIMLSHYEMPIGKLARIIAFIVVVLFSLLVIYFTYAM